MAGEVILLKAHPSEKYDEGVVKTGESILPGMLIECTDTAARDAYGRQKWEPHTTAGGDGERVIAVEDYLQLADVDTAYASTGLVRFHKCQRTDRLNIRLADGESVQPDDFLSSDGAGAFKRIGTGNASDVPLFKAAEVKDNSAGGATTLVMADCV